MNDWIAWETWNADGYCIRTSNAHIEGRNDDGDETGRAVCGTAIPAEGNGIVWNGTDVSNGLCKACLKWERKQTD